jgi:hypothetical protein
MAKLDLLQLKIMVEQAADLTSEAREASERDRDYYDGHQWTQEELAALRKRKQPPTVINRIQRKIDAMVGIEQRSRTDPKAYPRNPNDEEAADIATKALVYVDDQTRFDVKKSASFENMLIEGYGGVEVTVEPVKTRQGMRMDVAINRLRWEEIFFDPHSREKDFSDASYIGTQKWMSLDAALELYEGVYQGDDDLEQVLKASMSTVAEGQTYDDRPYSQQQMRWGDKRQQRVRIAQTYYRRKGVWYLAIYTSGGMIYNEVSPYVDEHGDPTCPIILMTAYVDRDNRRYGLVRTMISQQDEINKRRSKLLHQLNSRQTMGIKGAVNVAEMKRELAKADGHVEVDADAQELARELGMPAFQVMQNQDQVMGQFQLLQESKAEIDLVGPNPSLVGQATSGASGRAIQAQQQAGLAELAPIYDSLRDWTIRVYRAVWERIKQYWTEERWIRITDEEQVAEFVGLNVVQGYMQVIDMQTGMPTIQPQIQNPVAEMDVDIIIEEAPDYVSLRHEAFEQLSEMAARGIPIPPEMVIEASSLHNKSDLLERLRERDEAAAQGQAQAMQMQEMMMQMQAQLEQMTAQSKAQRDMAAAEKDLAQADKIRAETQGEQVDTAKTVVETQRLALGF